MDSKNLQYKYNNKVRLVKSTETISLNKKGSVPLCSGMFETGFKFFEIFH